MGFKQDYNQGKDITLGSAIAIMNTVLKEDYEILKTMELTRDEAIKKSYNAWTLERLIEKYLGKRLIVGMDSWKFFWCMLWFDIYKTKIIDDGLKSVSTVTGIQLHKNIKNEYENRFLSDIIQEYKGKYCNKKGWM